MQPYTLLNYPYVASGNSTSAFQRTIFGLDATYTKAFHSGRLWIPDRAAKTLTKVWLPMGAVSVAGGTGINVSLQDLAASSNPSPDGTKDQQADVAAVSLASDSYVEVTLGASRSVSLGDRFAVVVEFDSGGRLGSDTIYLANFQSAAQFTASQIVGRYTAASWGTVSQRASPAVFEFSDGTFGCFFGCVPATTIAQTLFGSTSSPNKYAAKMTLTQSVSVSGWWINNYVTNGSSAYDVNLLDSGGSVLATASKTSSLDFGQANYSYRTGEFASEVTLTAGTYYLEFAPTTTNTINLPTFETRSQFVNLFPGLYSQILATRTGTGAWTETNTSVPDCGLIMSDVGSSGGGLLLPRSMNGGFGD